MIICAVDPGITGALALYNTDYPAEVQVHDMPVLDGDVSPHGLKEHILNLYPHVAIIEHVSPMPKEGVRSVWRFSAAFTTACVVMKMMNVPLILVTPAKWKRDMNVKGGPEGKEQCRRLAIERFPECANVFSRKKDHGRAEAAILAVYASTLPTVRNHYHEQQHSVSETDPA
jgi:hypothetical protein